MYKLCRLIFALTVLLAAYVMAVAVAFVPLMRAVAIAVIIAIACRRNHRYTSYGTARWADGSDLIHLTDGEGLIVGKYSGRISKHEAVKALIDSRLTSQKACQKFLMAFQRKPQLQVKLTRAIHTAVFAPTGSGKGVSCVIPFLLTCRDSCVVVDFKGENARITADARRRMGHRVVLVDLFKIVTAEPDCFNPLDFIDGDSPTALDDCRDLAEALVVRSGQEKDPHWADSAEAWITALIAVVVAFAGEGDKNLQSVRSLLTNPEKMQAAIAVMCHSDLWDGILARLGHQLTQFKDKELSSTLTTTNRFMRFLDTLAVADSTKRSSFNPAGLLKGRMTVFLILPPEHQRAQTPLLRLWIGSLLRAVVRGGLQEKTKVHFVLDEAASLGHMDALDDAVDKYRGYGVRLQLYYQSVGQLKKCWPEGGEQTLLSQVSQVFFAVNDQQTAEYVSARLGDETIVATSGGTSTGSTWQTSQQGSTTSYSSNTSDNWQQLGRRLLRPEEVAGLDERLAITFTPGVPPIWTRLVRYYERDFKATRLGTWKVMLNAACLFLCAAIIAVMMTAPFVCKVHPR